MAFHPGNVASSFGKQSQSRLMRFITTNAVTRAMMITPEKGADQLVWLAEGRPGADWQPGEYYEKRRPARTTPTPTWPAGSGTARSSSRTDHAHCPSLADVRTTEGDRWPAA